MSSPPAPQRTPTPAGADVLLLPAATAMDAVTLHVADLEGMSSYYRRTLGLEELPTDAARPTTAAVTAVGRSPAAVALGRAGTPLVVLVHTPGLPAPGPGTAGLFHTALLLPDRASLATVLASAVQHPRSQYAGCADHLVSQAFCFTDPEGNGNELYGDRPRETWTWRGGQVAIASLPLDPTAFRREHLAEQAPPAPAWATSTSRSATSPRHGPSPSTPSASRSLPTRAAPCSQPPAATTTTWPWTPGRAPAPGRGRPLPAWGRSPPPFPGAST